MAAQLGIYINLYIKTMWLDLNIALTDPLCQGEMLG